MKVLKPIKNIPHNELSDEIVEFLKKELYLPLAKYLKVEDKISNALQSPLNFSIQSNTIFYDGGSFKGKFNAATSKELKSLGAKFKKGNFYISEDKLPQDILHSISVSEVNFKSVLNNVNQHLATLNPDFSKIDISKHFDKGIFKLNKTFEESVKSISVPSKLDMNQWARINDEYETDLTKGIQTWWDEEILKLRKKTADIFFKGNRYDSLSKFIEKSFQVGKSKANFLARQETSLLSSKFREVRYQDAGVDSYVWTCVKGSSLHPVRPLHQHLDGKIFKFSDPPVSGTRGEKQNPGEPFGCRCVAAPCIFKDGKEEEHQKWLASFKK